MISLGKALPGFLTVALFCSGCASNGDGAERGALPGKSTRGDVVEFAFVTTKGELVSTASERGRVTVLLFATTFDLNSQGAVRLLAQEVTNITPRINAAVVMIEPPKNMELIRVYEANSDGALRFAISDDATFRGEGPFGQLKIVPSFVVLDDKGRFSEAFSGLPTRQFLAEAVERAR